MNSVPARSVQRDHVGLNLGFVVVLVWCTAFWVMVAVGIDLLL